MSTRSNKRRAYQLMRSRLDGNFQQVRSAEEQAWLDIAPIGREFGSPDYERLQIFDLCAAGNISYDDAMLKLGMDT